MNRSRAPGALIAVLAAVFASSPQRSASQDVWLQNGRATAGPNLASSGDFGVMQIATPDVDALLAEWEKPVPTVSLVTATQTERNAPIVTFIIFRGCRAGSDGFCNVTAVFEIFDPTGKPYGNQEGPVWVGLPPPPPPAVQLSMGAAGLRVEDKDPLGAYRVTATVTDHVANVTLRTEQILTAVEARGD